LSEVVVRKSVDGTLETTISIFPKETKFGVIRRYNTFY